MKNTESDNYGFLKWNTCNFAIQFGLFANDEAGYELKEAGIIENYGCEHPRVILNSEKNEYLPNENLFIAKLSEGGKPTDERIKSALLKSCSNCQFYKSKINNIEKF